MSHLFISDLHFGHQNGLRYDNRPFEDIDTQDIEIIKRWNEKVTPEDDVWILGDISWYSASKTVEVMSQLNGRLHLVVGNHDAKLLKDKNVRDLFVEVVDYKELYLDKKTVVVLCHYPIPCYKNHFHGWFHFYGHVHMTFEWTMIENFQKEMQEVHQKKSNMFNVGCMIPGIDYVPRTFEEILQINGVELNDESQEC